MSKSNYLLIYLKTGGGHLAPAKSVAGYLNRVYGRTINPILVNGFEKAPEALRYMLEDGYRILQAKAKWYYELLYFINKFPLLGLWNRFLTKMASQNHIEQMILEHKPEKIIVFHFFSYQPVYTALRKHNLSIPVLTVVTDPFTAHPLWFMRKKQNFIVFSPELKEKVIRKGIPADSVAEFPFILDEKFSSPVPPDDVPGIKQKLGFHQSERILLLVGGGDGLPNAFALIKELISAGFIHQMVVVCGKNLSLKKHLEELKQEHAVINLHIYGYVDFVYELLSISEVVVTKCGASTIMEILHTCKVPVIIDYIWEQEKGNMEYVVKNHFGIYEKNISKISEMIHKLYSDPDYYQSFAANIKNAHLSSGTAPVSEYIVQFNKLPDLHA